MKLVVLIVFLEIYVLDLVNVEYFLYNSVFGRISFCMYIFFVVCKMIIFGGILFYVERREN